MRLFLIFTPIFGLQRTELNCLEQTNTKEKFGSLTYNSFVHWDCISFLNADAVLSSCAIETRNLKADLDQVIKCTLATSQVCPDAPLGCETKTTTDTDSCEYECKNKPLECEGPSHPYEVSMGLVETKPKIACFNRDVTICETSKPEATNQLVLSCDQPECGYMMTNTSFSMTFDENTGIEAVYTFPGEDFDIFECNANPKKHPDGCDCAYSPGGSTTTLTCGSAAYTFACNGDDDKSCLDNKCYKGKPIMDKEDDFCLVNDDETEYEYCKRQKSVELPCGTYENKCSLEANGKYNCECLLVPDKASCDTLKGVFVTGSPGTCTIENISYISAMMECEKRQCFDDDFEKKTCFKDTSFDAKYWLCFDSFNFIKIDEASSANKNIKAQETYGLYDNLKDCDTETCIVGQCACGDTAHSRSASYCKSKGEYYVSEIATPKTSEEETTETPDELEFHCLSFSETRASVNNITDVSEESECYALKAPSNGEKMECPSVKGCTTEEKTINGTQFGFYECSCDEKCSYKCDNDKYDPIFPEGWTSDKQEAGEFVTYECEKDNLVMIICTSIFVPLGVAGIAAGVYFFFFHESSEVAPVETDTELGSKSEDNSVNEEIENNDQKEKRDSEEN